MELNQYTPKGDLKGLPIEVIKQMLIEQVAQGNKEDIEVFEYCNNSNRINGGFDWVSTKLERDGWYKAINEHDFTDFYKMYPNVKPYPKVMLVWDKEGGEIRRVKIEGEFNGKFMERLGNGHIHYAWNFAKDIEEND